MEGSSHTLTRMFVAEWGLACSMIVCIIIAFTGNGLEITVSRYDGKSVTYNRGLWYETKCTEGKGCTYKSKKALYDDGRIDKLSYYGDDVDKQVLVTLSLCFSYLIGFLYLLTFVKVIEQRRIRPIVLSLCITIGEFLLTILVYEGIRQVLQHKYNVYHFRFPWTLMFLGFAGTIAVVLGSFNFFFTVCKHHAYFIDPSGLWKPLPFVIELSLMILSFILQIAVHGGDGMEIFENTNSQNSSIITQERFGIWYVTICNGTERRTMSRMEYILLQNSGNPPYFQEIDEDRLTVGLVRMSTISISTLIAVILYVIGTIKRNENFTRKLRMTLLTCTVIAGVVATDSCVAGVWWQVMSSEQLQINYRREFPWSLFLLGLSAVINLVVAGINLVLTSCKLCRTTDQLTEEELSLSIVS